MPEMKSLCTGIILAGGLSRRLNGKNKALLCIEEHSFLERIYEVFTHFFDTIILVSNEPWCYLDWDILVVSDLIPVRSSLTGLHTGLFYMSTPFGFVTACDRPFLSRELVGALLDEIEPSADIIVPQTKLGVEPLLAVYSKRCEKPVHRQLLNKQYKIRSIFEHLRVKKIPEIRLRRTDPELLSLVNVNTPEDLNKVRKLSDGGSE